MAVRKIAVFQHHGCPIEASLKPLEHHNNTVLKGLREPLNWVPIMLTSQSLGLVSLVRLVVSVIRATHR